MNANWRDYVIKNKLTRLSDKNLANVRKVIVAMWWPRLIERLSMTFTANGKLHHVTYLNRNCSFTAHPFCTKNKYSHARFIH